MERNQLNKILDEHGNLRFGFNAISTRTTDSGIALTTPIITMGQEKLARRVNIEYENGFREYWEEYIRLREEGYVPVNIANHTAQQDAFSMGVLTRDQLKVEESLPEELRANNFLLPVSAALVENHHGRPQKIIYEAGKKFLDKYGIVPEPLVRDKDVKEFGMKPNNIEFTRKARKSLSKNNGFIGFLEANTKGGALNSNEELIGMGEFEENAFNAIIRASRSVNKKIMITPVGMTGGHLLQNQASKLPSARGLGLAFGLSKNGVVDINVGQPIAIDTGILGELLEAGDMEGAHKFLGETIAALLPPEYRGIYK